MTAEGDDSYEDGAPVVSHPRDWPHFEASTSLATPQTAADAPLMDAVERGRLRTQNAQRWVTSWTIGTASPNSEHSG